MRPVLKWVRANLYTVICAAVMLAAPLALWFYSGGMNSAVRQEVQRRAAKVGELGKFESTPISLESPVPGNDPVSARIAVNRKFLERYQQVVGKLREDAARIREEVIGINRKGRGVLNEKLFPAALPQERETLPKEMYRQLIAAYTQLLKDVRAGSPPSGAQMAEYLGQARDRFLTEIRKRSTDALTPQEQGELTEQLSAARLSYCADAARALSFYADLADLSVPDESRRPDRAEGQGMIDMFNWQWELWIKEDLLRAIASANQAYPSVLEAPVKRVISIAVQSAPAAAVASAADEGGESGPAGGFAIGSGGMSSGGRGGGGEARAAVPAVAADPAQEAPLDYTVSFTGRRTNPLYDVWYVGVDLIVDSAQVPALFDALARQNFMTVVDAQVDTVDPFEDLRAGYVYGTAPVSRVSLVVETIWIREWTAPLMPAELKAALGIPMPPPASPAG
jgi:hypothetical protein